MLIDLSHTIATGMMQVAALPPVEVCRVSNLADGNPTNGQALRISGHSGTHIDAPLHVFDELASRYREEMLAGELQYWDQAYFAGEARESLAKQRERERSDSLSFDDFLADYFGTRQTT